MGETDRAVGEQVVQVAMTPDMNAALRARLEQLLGHYDQVRSDLAAARARTREVQGTARSADGGMTVTVGPRGALISVEIDPRTYRKLGPSEICERLVELSAEAVRDVTRQMEEIMRPFLPRHVDYKDIVKGTADVTTLGTEPVTNETFDEWWAGFGRPSAEGQHMRESGGTP